MKEDITASFIAQYKKTPDHCHFAPGRANIIGEHTDYNEGFVLPYALEKGIWFAGPPGGPPPGRPRRPL